MIGRALTILVFLGAAARADTGAPRPTDELRRHDYRFGVALECGLVDDPVIAGYLLVTETIVARLLMTEESRRHTRATAFIAVEREWSNRGLGGYRTWCRTEGADAAARFRAAAP